MTRDDWVLNVESVTNEVASLCGNETVQFVLDPFHAADIYELSETSLQDVSNELFSYVENAH